MKKTFLFPIFSLLFASEIFSQSVSSYPVFVLDDRFSQAQPAGSKIVPRNYVLSSRTGFILDCSKYDFSPLRDLNNGKNPDAIFIVSKSGTYSVKLHITSSTTVDRSTMLSLDNPKKEFRDFQKNDTLLLAIGTLKKSNGKAEMATYWVSFVSVK